MTVCKGIEFWINFFVVLVDGLVVLDMPGCDRLQLLNINCNTTTVRQLDRQIKEKTQDTSKTNIKNNPQNSNEVKQEIDYLIAGPGKEANIVASVNQHRNFTKI